MYFTWLGFFFRVLHSFIVKIAFSGT